MKWVFQYFTLTSSEEKSPRALKTLWLAKVAGENVNGAMRCHAMHIVRIAQHTPQKDYTHLPSQIHHNSYMEYECGSVEKENYNT